jgi:hypothetical protein
VTKRPNIKNLREKGFILAYGFREFSVHVCLPSLSWQQENKEKSRLGTGCNLQRQTPVTYFLQLGSHLPQFLQPSKIVHQFVTRNSTHEHWRTFHIQSIIIKIIVRPKNRSFEEFRKFSLLKKRAVVMSALTITYSLALHYMCSKGRRIFPFFFTFLWTIVHHCVHSFIHPTKAPTKCQADMYKQNRQ